MWGWVAARVFAGASERGRQGVLGSLLAGFASGRAGAEGGSSSDEDGEWDPEDDSGSDPPGGRRRRPNPNEGYDGGSSSSSSSDDDSLGIGGGGGGGGYGGYGGVFWGFNRWDQWLTMYQRNSRSQYVLDLRPSSGEAVKREEAACGDRRAELVRGQEGRACAVARIVYGPRVHRVGGRRRVNADTAAGVLACVCAATLYQPGMLSLAKVSRSGACTGLSTTPCLAPLHCAPTARARQARVSAVSGLRRAQPAPRTRPRAPPALFARPVTRRPGSRRTRCPHRSCGCRSRRCATPRAGSAAARQTR